VVRDVVPGATPPQARAGRHRRRRPHADPGAHRLAARPSPRSCGHRPADVTTPPPEERTHRTRVLYISPLRALASTSRRTCGRRCRASAGRRAPRRAVHEPTVGMRTGDTPADERRKLVRNPPDMLITTPESLYLMLTSAARETLSGVEAVIIDEIHALAATKRGAHLALTLERSRGSPTARPPAAHRAVGHPAPARGDRPFLGGSTPTACPARSPSSTPACARSSTSRSSSRSRTWASSARSSTSP
jgi:ATP-dependent helicase Lhr and Lhr-like helicase